jgi:hypothetical protein
MRTKKHQKKYAPVTPWAGSATETGTTQSRHRHRREPTPRTRPWPCPSTHPARSVHHSRHAKTPEQRLQLQTTQKVRTSGTTETGTTQSRRRHRREPTPRTRPWPCPSTHPARSVHHSRHAKTPEQRLQLQTTQKVRTSGTTETGTTQSRRRHRREPTCTPPLAPGLGPVPAHIQHAQSAAGGNANTAKLGLGD